MARPAEAVAAAGHRAVAYDQRGAGRSEKPAGPYSVEHWADDLAGCSTRSGSSALRWSATRSAAWSPSTAARRARRARAGRWRSAAGRCAWRPEAAPVFEERVRLARAGRMDEIAERSRRPGSSERCRAERTRACSGCSARLIASNDPVAYAECSAATAGARRCRSGARRLPDRSRSAASRTRSRRRPPPRRSRRARSRGETARDRGRRPLVPARGAGGGQRRPPRLAGHDDRLATLSHKFGDSANLI